MVNRLSTETRAQVVSCLVEVNSIRYTVRLTGAARTTVTKLIVELGIACSKYQDRTLRGLTCQRVQADEIWSFVGAKKANVTPEHHADYGDAWTFVCIDDDTKLGQGRSRLVTTRCGPVGMVHFLSELVRAARWRTPRTIKYPAWS